LQSDRSYELEKQLRTFFSGRDYRPVQIPELLEVIGAKEKERSDLEAILDRLEEQGVVVPLEGRGWFSTKGEGWAVGTLTIARGGFGFVRSLVEDPLGDVFVPERKISDGHHGDRVVVKLMKPRSGAPRSAREGRHGRIVTVLQRSPRVFLGILRDGHGNFSTVEPLLHESVREVHISTDQRAGAVDGDRVLAQLLEGPTVGGLPPGRVIEVAEEEGSWKGDLQRVAAEHGLPRNFSEAAQEQAVAFSREISEKEISRRSDLRDLPFFTIDPADAKDFDDAVMLEGKGDGSWRVAVAIADVSHFVAEGSEIDLEAHRRGTSVYLPGLTIPMLPERLSCDLCSLRPGEDRLAMVVWMDIDEAGELTSWKVEKAVIRSVRRFQYSEVQAILDGEGEVAEEDPLASTLDGLNELRDRLRRMRIRRGSLDLDLEEMQLILDDHGEVLDVRGRSRDVAHNLIEELMLIANEAVARTASEASIAVLRRIHDQPATEDIDRFIRFCRVIAPWAQVGGVDHLQGVVEAVKGSPVEAVINYALLRTLTQARYQVGRSLHFALATDEYCHFTSPIRRYPDLQVHRALDRFLFADARDLPESMEVRSASLQELAEHCSTKEREAEDAEREMKKLRAISWLCQRVGERFTGLISSVSDHGFFVRLDGCLIEGMVHVRSLRDDLYIHNEEQFALRGRNKGRTFRLGDPVEVLLEGADSLHRHIDLRYLHHRQGGEAPLGGGSGPLRRVLQKKPRKKVSTSAGSPGKRSKGRRRGKGPRRGRRR